MLLQHINAVAVAIRPEVLVIFLNHSLVTSDQPRMRTRECRERCRVLQSAGTDDPNTGTFLPLAGTDDPKNDVFTVITGPRRPKRERIFRSVGISRRDGVDMFPSRLGRSFNVLVIQRTGASFNRIIVSLQSSVGRRYPFKMAQPGVCQIIKCSLNSFATLSFVLFSV